LKRIASFWIDACYFRQPNNSPTQERCPVIRNNITANGDPPTQLFVQNIFNDSSRPATDDRRKSLGCCHKSFIWPVLWNFPVHGQKYICCVGFEQLVLVVMCQTFTSLCCIQYSGDDGNWFAMGPDMIPNPKRTIMLYLSWIAQDTNS
jgi:hypothetical protein